jgi:hypothetical protein
LAVFEWVLGLESFQDNIDVLGFRVGRQCAACGDAEPRIAAGEELFKFP